MKSYFSCKTLGLYPESILGMYEAADALPLDLVELTEEQYGEFAGAASNGMILGADKDGGPVWVDIPPLPHDQLVAEALAQQKKLKSIADSEIYWRQDAVDGGYAEGDEVTELAAWKKYRVLLMRVDTSTAPDIEWPLKPE